MRFFVGMNDKTILYLKNKKQLMLRHHLRYKELRYDDEKKRNRTLKYLSNSEHFF